jgi:hypothetical protein
LPVGPTGYGNSPYQLISSFAGNALLINPECLISEEIPRRVIASFTFRRTLSTTPALPLSKTAFIHTQRGLRILSVPLRCSGFLNAQGLRYAARPQSVAESLGVAKRGLSHESLRLRPPQTTFPDESSLNPLALVLNCSDRIGLNRYFCVRRQPGIQ